MKSKARGPSRKASSVWNSMFSTPRSDAASRATSSIAGERSTATTAPPRRSAGRASGSANRPAPHPYEDRGRREVGRQPFLDQREHVIHERLPAVEELAFGFGRQLRAQESGRREHREVRLSGGEGFPTCVRGLVRHAIRRPLERYYRADVRVEPAQRETLKAPGGVSGDGTGVRIPCRSHSDNAAAHPASNGAASANGRENAEPGLRVTMTVPAQQTH